MTRPVHPGTWFTEARPAIGQDPAVDERKGAAPASATLNTMSEPDP